MNNYILSLGSNLGERKKNLDRGLRFLSEIGRIIKKTPIYETLPVEMEETSNFYNMVVEFEVELSPVELLNKIKDYEKSEGRDIKNSHLKPRTIDIDILLNEDNTVNEKNLIIPHKEITNRYFILFLLNKLNPEIIINNKRVKNILLYQKKEENHYILRKID